MLLPLLLTALAALPQGDAKLSNSDEQSFRELLTSAVFAPDLKARATALERADEFANFRMSDLVEAVRKGPIYAAHAAEARTVANKLETLEEFGGTVSGYSFVVNERVYRYAVSLPRRYDAKKAWPLLVDPGHNSAKDEPASVKAGMLDFYRQSADGAGCKEWIVIRTEIIEQIGAGGLQGAKPEDEVVAVFDEFFRDVYSRFHVDLSRVFVAGISQTGYWSWYLAAARPCRFSGIVPVAAVTWQVEPVLENLRNLAIFVAHGDEDETCPVKQPRATVRRLASIGANVVYKEVDGGKHDGSTFRYVRDGLEFVAQFARDPYPKRVSKALSNLSEGGFAYWLRVDKLAREDQGKASSSRNPTGGIDAELDGQTINLYSEGVERVTLCLSSEMLDLESAVQVNWNGNSVHDDKLRPSAATLLELVAAKGDWRGTFEAKLELACPGD